MCSARLTGPATESDPVSTIVIATAASTNGSCAVAWYTMADNTRLAATPRAIPTPEPTASSVSMRPSAAESICLPCAPSATRRPSSRSRLLTV